MFLALKSFFFCWKWCRVIKFLCFAYERCASLHWSFCYLGEPLTRQPCRVMKVISFASIYHRKPAGSPQKCFIWQWVMGEFICRPQSRRTSHIRLVVRFLSVRPYRARDTSTFDICPSQNNRCRTGVIKRGVPPYFIARERMPSATKLWTIL